MCKFKKAVVLFSMFVLFCVFSTNSFATNATPAQTAHPRALSVYYFKDANSTIADYPVYTANPVSEGDSRRGYVIIIQEILDSLYDFDPTPPPGNRDLNPNGIDGIFGHDTKCAVICFQNMVSVQGGGDGVVGAYTWEALHHEWTDTLGSPNIVNLTY